MFHRQLVSLAVLGYAAMTTVSARADLFTHPSSWGTYDPGANDVGDDPDGYIGAAFDGRYIYFAPYQNGPHPARHGEVLRYDTTGRFDDSTSWATYDYGADPQGCALDDDCDDPDGYKGAAFDGRYVYFAPCYNGTGYHGEVLRYDTNGDFDTAASWKVFDAMNHPNVLAKGGYTDVCLVGDYLYFVPDQNDDGDHGEVLRYRITGSDTDFNDPTLWETYEYAVDPDGCAQNPNCTNPQGYYGCVGAGQHVYFVPYRHSSAHSEVLRYDTTGAFTAAGSWDTHDPDKLGGYLGGVFDGRYIYFVPGRTGDSSFHSEVLRYDTSSDFHDTASSWAVYDPGYNDGYHNAIRVGQYIYFGPFQENSGGPHGEVLRYDTTMAFKSAAAWAAYDYGDSQECLVNPNCTDPDGFAGVISDGRYVYFTPMHQDTGGGEVLRYDTANTLPPIPAVSDWGVIAVTLLVLTAATLTLRGRRLARV